MAHSKQLAKKIACHQNFAKKIACPQNFVKKIACSEKHLAFPTRTTPPKYLKARPLKRATVYLHCGILTWYWWQQVACWIVSLIYILFLQFIKFNSVASFSIDDLLVSWLIFTRNGYFRNLGEFFSTMFIGSKSVTKFFYFILSSLRSRHFQLMVTYKKICLKTKYFLEILSLQPEISSRQIVFMRRI